MTHFMKLNQQPFERMQDGQKTIELRLYDEKRRHIKVGDTVCFTSDRGRLTATVKALYVYQNFEDLYASLPLEQCGYTPGELAAATPEDMLAYYSEKQIKKYGVVGIEIEVIKSNAKVLNKSVKVTVDRPLGSYHPKHRNLYYPINYGYIEGIIAPDGEEQDAYIIGVDEPVSKFEGIVIAVIHRKDDIEEKWVVAPVGSVFTKAEIEAAVHFQEQFFDTEITMCEVKFHEAVEDTKLTFAVIAARSNGQWVFCKHKARASYEFPGGHREAGESILATARRELQEETGAVDFKLTPVTYYSVTAPDVFDGKETFGLLCYAEIAAFEDELHSEIESILLTEVLPENWTYPLIQPWLFSALRNTRNENERSPQV